MERDEVIALLTGLIERCQDAEYGYSTAADYIESKQFSTLFQEFSQQRTQFIKQLTSQVRYLGGNVDSDSGGFRAYRAWSNIKSAARSNDIRAVLQLCEHSENSALVSYQQALKHDLPQDLHDLLQHQYQQIKDSHERIRATLDALAAV